MKNTDKITLTIGQLKRLIKESKFKKVLKEFHETDKGDILTYNDILDYLEGLSVTDLMDIGDYDVDRFMDNFVSPINGAKVDDAMFKMAELLIRGGGRNLDRTMQQLRRQYGEKKI